MKILSKQEKRLKKQEYKEQHKYQYNDKLLDFRNMIVPTYVRRIELKKYGKRVDQYIYHYNRLMNKKDFLEKRIFSLSLPVKRELLENKEYASIVSVFFKFTYLKEKLEKMDKMCGLIVDDDVIIYELESFYRLLLIFSSLIKKVSDVLDKFDPKNKNKFKYNRLKNFLLYGRNLYGK